MYKKKYKNNYTTVQKFGVSMIFLNVFETSLSFWLKLYLCDYKYSNDKAKLWNISTIYYKIYIF